MKTREKLFVEDRVLLWDIYIQDVCVCMHGYSCVLVMLKMIKVLVVNKDKDSVQPTSLNYNDNLSKAFQEINLWRRII